MIPEENNPQPYAIGVGGERSFKSFALILLFFWMSWSPARTALDVFSTSPWDFWRVGFNAALVGLAATLAIFYGRYFLMQFALGIRYFGWALKVTQEGLHCRGIDLDLIPWSTITAARLAQRDGRPVIEIEAFLPTATLSRPNILLRRWVDVRRDDKTTVILSNHDSDESIGVLCRWFTKYAPLSAVKFASLEFAEHPAPSTPIANLDIVFAAPLWSRLPATTAIGFLMVKALATELGFVERGAVPGVAIMLLSSFFLPDVHSSLKRRALFRVGPDGISDAKAKWSIPWGDVEKIVLTRHRDQEAIDVRLRPETIPSEQRRLLVKQLRGPWDTRLSWEYWTNSFRIQVNEVDVSYPDLMSTLAAYAPVKFDWST
jgi:hypothetical protein